MLKNILILAMVTAMHDEVFAANPNINDYFKTSDGQTFYKDGDAKAHARSLQDKNVERVVKGVEAVTEDVSDNPETIKLTAAEVIALVVAAETTEELDPYRNDTRTTVLQAIEKKDKAFAEAAAATQNPE